MSESGRLGQTVRHTTRALRSFRGAASHRPHSRRRSYRPARPLLFPVLSGVTARLEKGPVAWVGSGRVRVGCGAEVEAGGGIGSLEPERAESVGGV